MEVFRGKKKKQLLHNPLIRRQMFFENFITTAVLWKYADSVHIITPRAINYISKCLSQNALLNTAIKYETRFIVNILPNCFQFQLSESLHTIKSIESIALRVIKLVFLCLKIYLQNCKFWSMLLHWNSPGAKSQNWGDTCTCSLPKEGPFVWDCNI